jgi:hypothetical protein
MDLTIKRKKLCPGYTPIGIFNGDYLIRELTKFEIQHLKKLNLFNNLNSIPQNLINNFLN